MRGITKCTTPSYQKQLVIAGLFFLFQIILIFFFFTKGQVPNLYTRWRCWLHSVGTETEFWLPPIERCMFCRRRRLQKSSFSFSRHFLLHDAHWHSTMHLTVCSVFHTDLTTTRHPPTPSRDALVSPLPLLLCVQTEKYEETIVSHLTHIFSFFFFFLWQRRSQPLFYYFILQMVYSAVK